MVRIDCYRNERLLCNSFILSDGACVCVCVCVCVYVCVSACMCVCDHFHDLCTCVHVYVCVPVCVAICMMRVCVCDHLYDACVCVTICMMYACVFVLQKGSWRRGEQNRLRVCV